MIPPDGACVRCWKPSTQYEGFCSSGCQHDWREGHTPPWYQRAAVLQSRCEKAEARVKALEALLQRAVPLAAYAQDIPRRADEAEQWHHDVAVALSGIAS